MLGMAPWSLHCKDGQEAGELQLNKSIYFLGLVLTGCSSALRKDGPRFFAKAQRRGQGH